MTILRSYLLFASSLVLFSPRVLAQTSSSCNPLYTSGCPADPALGTSKSISFTSEDSQDFTASGAPTYGSNGAAFTIAQSGDSPTIISKWYIMFGHVEFNLQAAPGQGIVSSAILQSDDLDEIDWEWLGGDDTQAQSNYFGKGLTTSGYNRGAFHSAPNNHDSFNTYSIDWTSEQIIWAINGNTVRVLTQADAEPNQYPQTPMQVKVGIWAGGDPANAPGTIEWAGGPVNYAAGPFTMYLKSMAVTDYSTGSSYSYDGTSGSWQSIVSNGGTIYGGASGKNTPSVSDTPTVTTATGAPIPLTTDAAESSILATRTGYPWSGSSDVSVSAPPQFTSSQWSASSAAASSGSVFEAQTSYSQPGYPDTTATLLVSATGPTATPVSSATSDPAAASSTTLLTLTLSTTVPSISETSSIFAVADNSRPTSTEDGSPFSLTNTAGRTPTRTWLMACGLLGFFAFY